MGKRLTGSVPLERVRRAILQTDSVTDRLEIVCSHYQVPHATYSLGRRGHVPVELPFVRTTYPLEWVGLYLLRGYGAIDPVVTEGYSRSEPFDWSEIPEMETMREFWGEAARYGVGRNGYTIPIIDRLGRRAMFSLNDSGDPVAWKELTLLYGRDWAMLATVIHESGIREAYGDEDAVPALAPRERECLSLAARGKDHKEISRLLQISEHTTRGYLKSAREKLNAGNITHAVVEAMKMKLIDPN